MVEDDEEQMKEELKEAFRIYDKEVPKTLILGKQKITKNGFLSGVGGAVFGTSFSNITLRFRDPKNT